MSGTAQITKTIHVLKSPYQEPLWPNITVPLELQILDLLLPLLEVAGQSQSRHTSYSRKRRKRKAGSGSEGLREQKRNDQAGKENQNAQSVPDFSIMQHLTVGFNSTVRYLELLAQKRQGSREGQVDRTPWLSAVFVCKAGLPTVMTDPLPLLAAMASSSDEIDIPILLVPISQSAASKIAKALQCPKVNILGILSDGPEFEKLDNVLRDNINPTDVSWIGGSASRSYQHVKTCSKEIVAAKSSVKNTQSKRKVNEID